MKKMLLFIALFVVFTQACIVRDPSPPYVEYETEYIHFYDYYDVSVASDYYAWCEYSSPYYEAPGYCQEDYYEEYTCCSWDVGYGCFEEWCFWNDTCEWYFDQDECY